MSETFWLAVLGITGTLMAGTITPWLQSRHDRRKFILEVYLNHKLDALQHLYTALYECTMVFRNRITQVLELDEYRSLDKESLSKFIQLREAHAQAAPYLTGAITPLITSFYEQFHAAQRVIFDFALQDTAPADEDVLNFLDHKLPGLVDAGWLCLDHLGKEFQPRALEKASTFRQ